MIEHRNVGYDWQFSNYQERLSLPDADNLGNQPTKLQRSSVATFYAGVATSN
jgi:hypothetical protein